MSHCSAVYNKTRREASETTIIVSNQRHVIISYSNKEHKTPQTHSLPICPALLTIAAILEDSPFVQ